jgi:hypothetical protein
MAVSIDNQPDLMHFNVILCHCLFEAPDTVFPDFVANMTGVDDDMRLISLKDPRNYCGITVITHALPDIAINIIL